VPFVDVQGQILMLPEVAVVTGQRPAAVGGVVGGIGVENHLGGGVGTGADKEIDEVAIENLQAVGLGGADLQQDGAFCQRQFGLAAVKA
jgi:hypothetical protein